MGGAKKQQQSPKEQQKSAEQQQTSSRRFSDEAPVKAAVISLIVRTGARGEITQVECKVLEGKHREKIMRRNVKGSVRVGDLLTLRETEIEARRVKGATKGSHA